MSDLSLKIDSSGGISSEHFKQAKEYLITFITEIENNNYIIETLKKEILNKNSIIEEKDCEIENFNKVSIISSLNKQLTEKDNIIKKLEYQLETTKKKLVDTKLSIVNQTDDNQSQDNNANEINDNEMENIADNKSQDSNNENENLDNDEINNDKEENSVKNTINKKKKRQFIEVEINSKTFYICETKIYKKLKSGKISKKSIGTYIDKENFNFD